MLSVFCAPRELAMAERNPRIIRRDVLIAFYRIEDRKNMPQNKKATSNPTMSDTELKAMSDNRYSVYSIENNEDRVNS
jgi:hypothetical protein